MYYGCITDHAFPFKHGKEKRLGHDPGIYACRDTGACYMSTCVFQLPMGAADICCQDDDDLPRRPRLADIASVKALLNMSRENRAGTVARNTPRILRCLQPNAKWAKGTIPADGVGVLVVASEHLTSN
ncbi:hypothetical protein BD779DRAFT_1473428 [Infundibulicybe gibba]|nr:hypothetical protein BD779DRAFT_1473428 [Infundibulicybe gibba]